jgi:hypothetical protein
MLQVLEQIQKQKTDRGDQGLDVDVIKVDLDLPDQDTNLDNIAVSIAEEIFIELGKKNPGIDSLKQFPTLFPNEVIDRLFAETRGQPGLTCWFGELLKLYQNYLDKNKKWMFKQAPRRSDMRVFEAVFHFNLYAYINEFLRSKKGQVFPEFPTGNRGNIKH